jgi:hypothetical protein
MDETDSSWDLPSWLTVLSKSLQRIEPPLLSWVPKREEHATSKRRACLRQQKTMAL